MTTVGSRHASSPAIGVAVLTCIVVVSLTPTALAQPSRRGRASRNEIVQPGEPATEDDLDLATANADPTPPARELGADQTPELDVIEQAGVGGPVPYAASGVLEVGGSGYISGDDTQLWASLRPFVGFFPVDGFELSFTNELLFVYGTDQRLNAAILATLEPSVHLSLIDRLWLAIALGIGVIANGVDAGVVGTARLGVDVMIGRSTMFHIAAVGGLASVPFALPDDATPGTAHFRIGAELSFSALF